MVNAAAAKKGRETHDSKILAINCDVRAILNKYITSHGITITEFASRVGYDRSTISNYLRGSYIAKSAVKIERAIIGTLRAAGEWDEQYSDIEDGEDGEQAVSLEIVNTKDTREVLAMCQTCQEKASLGVIIGGSGRGKSFTLEFYSKKTKVYRIECDAGMGLSDLLYAIESIMGLPHHTSGRSIWRRSEAIKEFFHINPGCLLIIDEADKLIQKDSNRKLEIIRAIYDQSNVGIVISGEPSLWYLIEETLERFENRVEYFYEMEGLTKDEVKEFLSEYKVTVDAMEELIKRGTNPKNGCFRRLKVTIDNCLDIVGREGEITKDVIDEASKKMTRKKK